MPPFVGQRLPSFGGGADRERLAALRGLAEAGKAVLAVEAGHPLEEAPEALRRFGEAHARAKIVVTV